MANDNLPAFKMPKVDILKAFEEIPAPQDFIFPGLLAGSVGALVSPGATGKSYLMLEAAMAVAGGTDLLGFEPSKSGGVLYFAGEDPESEIIRRVHEIGAHLSPESRKAIASNLWLVAACGTRANIMDNAYRDFLVKQCTGKNGEKVVRLMVFDTLSRIHSMDENSNGEMSALISQLESIAKDTGAAVLYLHHVSKASAKDGQGDQQQATRGASALVDNARWVGYVAKMNEQEAKTMGVDADQRGFFVRYGVSKQNYGSPTPEKWFRRVTGGVLLPADFGVTALQSVATTARKTAKNVNGGNW